MMGDYKPLEDFRWKCPYSDCKYEILSYTQSSFDDRRSSHLNTHLQKMKEEREAREAKMGKLLPGYSKDPNKLLLSRFDLEQFLVHHIGVDDDCITEGVKEWTKS